MYAIRQNQQIPVYHLEPDDTGNRHFRVYNFNGDLPPQSDLLLPHRKNHYLIVLMRRSGNARHWVDTRPIPLKDNSIYFSGPNNVIVKEDVHQLYSTGLAITPEFLSFQDNAALSKLPLIINAQDEHELALTAADVDFVEDLLAKINQEYRKPGEWQQRMLSAHLTVLLTYLSRLYTEQYQVAEPSADTLLLKRYQARIDEYFRTQHEVADYAAMLNISAGHLSEVVKTQSGKPAIKHIHNRLVMEARRMLFHTETSLKEIAFELGFTDASYFNRFFKRETGVTPAEYRANIRKMYH